MLPRDNAHFRVGTRRLLAALIDGLVVLPLSVAEHLAASSSLSAGVRLGVLIAATVCWVAYPAVSHAVFGKTLGKALTGIIVVGPTGGPTGWSRAWIREAVPVVAGAYWIVSASRHLFHGSSAGLFRYPPSEADIFVQDALFWWVVLELVSMLTNAKRRAVHDLMAGTYVVRNQGLPGGVSRRDPP